MSEWAIAVDDSPHSWKVIADTSTEAVIKFMATFDKHISDESFLQVSSIRISNLRIPPTVSNCGWREDSVRLRNGMS